MIQLHPDFLYFQTKAGDTIPCSAESVTLELIGDAASILDPEVVREAAAAVVHYFKTEKQREIVSIAEFSQALEKVLDALGFTVVSSVDEIGPDTPVEPPEPNLCEALRGAEQGFELLFFQQLRQEYNRQAQTDSNLVIFRGLKQSVKILLGRKRWCRRCDTMSDQVVCYLRQCLAADHGSNDRGLVVI